MKNSIHVFIILIILIISLFTGCETLNSMLDTSKPLVFDSSVPPESTCLLDWSQSITIREFNGASVSWHRSIFIPSGDHEFLVDYAYEGYNNVGKMERHTTSGISVHFSFVSGHEYSIYSEEDSSSKSVFILLRDRTEQAEQQKQEKARIEEEFKTALPAESTEPTMLEGTWVWSPKGWDPRYLYIHGNSWQYDENNTSDKGLFSISGDTLTLFALNRKRGNNEWKSITDYQNAKFIYQFAIGIDGALRMKTVHGSGKDGPFYKSEVK